MRRFIAVLSLALSLTALPALANLELTIRVDGGPYKDASVPLTLQDDAPVVHATHHVVLAPSYVRDDANGVATTYDFAQRRIYVTSATRTVVRSLYGTVGSIATQMQTRVVNAGKSGADLVPLALSEHELSMSSGQPQEKLQRIVLKDGVQFRFRTFELASMSHQKVDASDAERIAFVRLIRLAFHAHPTILDDIRVSGIPRTLRIVHPTESREETLTITESKPSANATFTPPANAHLEIESDKVLGKLAVKALAGMPAGLDAKLDGEASKLAGQKKDVDAFLTAMEYTFTFDRKPPSLRSPAFTNGVFANADVRALTAAINANNAAAARMALVTMKRLHDVTTKDHVLSIFEGDTVANLRDTDKASAKFAAALTANPYITGAWKDLGSLYFPGYDANRAWDCWTIARRLSPHHPMLESIANDEAVLVRTYAEFF
jgi:hypothetical protein